MKNVFMIIAIAMSCIVNVNAQTCCATERGDWYVGTGDVANTAWTE
jgi:hypothetical protein